MTDDGEDEKCEISESLLNLRALEVTAALSCLLGVLGVN
jgi:hypothetical protein